MILKRLNINQLPGIDAPFQVEFRGSGMHLVHGPNGVGKSSLCKAIEKLYWNDQRAGTPISITGQFEIDGVDWTVERDGKSLIWSRTDGQESPRPELPAAHQAKCFFLQLRDLIDPSRDSLSDIATQINKQMTGGFDLDAVIESFPELTRHRTRNLDKAFSKASSDIEREQREQSNLQSREDHLETLETDLISAREKANQEASIDRALGLLEKRRNIDLLRTQFNRFPPQIGELRGDEMETLNKLEERLQSDCEEVKRLDLEVKSAREKQRDSKLTTPLDPENLTAQKLRADNLIRLEDTIITIERKIADHKGQLSKAIAAIGGTGQSDRQYNLKEHGQLYEFLGRCINTRNQQEIITTKIELLKKATTSQAPESKFDQIKGAIHALRMWLRAPDSESSSSQKVQTRWWIWIGVFLSLVGGILAYFSSLLFLVMAGAGLGILVISLLLLQSTVSSPPIPESREEAKASYRLTKLDEPDQWNVPTVKSWLAKLENELSRLSASAQKLQIQQTELDQLNLEFENVQSRQTELDTERQALAKELGLQNIPDMELVDYARALDRVREEQITLAGLQEKHRDSRHTHSRELEQLTAYITQHQGGEPSSGSEAKSIIDSLDNRSKNLKQALFEEQSTLRQIGRLKSEKEQTEQSIRDIFGRLSLDQGDMPKLKDLLNQQDSYTRMREQITGLQSQIELINQELESANESDLENHTHQDLELLKKQAEQAKHRVEEISGEISEINTLTEQAKKGNSMQDLITRREDARNELQNGLETQLQSHAVKFLIGQVKDQYEQKRIPRMFKRAKSHFARFTRNSYKLQLGRHDGKPTLQALELHTGKIRELDHLSDGTRAQLLIAARIAFAEEIERDLILPFFLDEALDQSDPQRFEAIVGCLGKVSADQQRQIVYLTSDPAEQVRIEQALELADCALTSSIDLGKIRKMSVSVDDITKLDFQSGMDIPKPSGQPYAEYALNLAVPEFTPTQGWFGQSISYVLPEDNELLYRFHKNHIQSAGQWGIVENQPLAEQLCDGILAPQEVGNRIELLKVFCELCSLGRGRPVGRHDLENSNAISDRYIQGVVDIARDIKGNASRLIEILRERKDERASGFRVNQIDKLEQYFLNSGYIDDRAVLDEDELLIRARATPAADNLSEDTSLKLIQKWQTLADGFYEQ
ncbi:MAG: hypothetical protein F4X92_08090 [Gammaproteobacteria bacterium]|nr:hypothetical protein [Gammaproteobacteria bacterium]